MPVRSRLGKKQASRLQSQHILIVRGAPKRTKMSNDEPSDVAQRKQKVSGVFSQVAVTYDRVGPRFFSHFGRRLVALAQIPGGAHVLDVATGRGAVLFPAAECVGPDEEEFWSTLWSHGSRAKLGKIEEARGPEGLLRFKADVFEGLQALKQADGIHQLFPVLFTLATRPRACGK
jgi:hypothetical protein